MGGIDPVTTVIGNRGKDLLGKQTLCQLSYSRSGGRRHGSKRPSGVGCLGLGPRLGASRRSDDACIALDEEGHVRRAQRLGAGGDTSIEVTNVNDPANKVDRPS